jgi:hypothetical protein
MQRKPFILSREAERATVDRGVRDPKKRQLLYEMIDAVLRVCETEKISESEIRPILAGFDVTDEAVWSRAAGWLAKVHAYSPDVSAILDQLAAHSNATVRWRFCASLGRFPKDTAIPFLKRFLRDRSNRIRGTVTTVTTAKDYKEMITDFESMLKEEENEEQRVELRQAIALLRGETFERDGMLVKRLPNGDLEYS